MKPAFVVTEIRDADALSVLAYQHATERVRITFRPNQFAPKGEVTEGSIDRHDLPRRVLT